MKRTLLLWSIVSLCSCSVQRAATVREKSDEQQVTAVTTAVETKIQQTVERQTDTNEQVTTTTEEYDTSRPVDPQTGTPPLKRRTTIRKETTTITAATQEQTASTAENRQAETTANTQTQREAAEQVDRKVGTHALIWCILGALAVGAVVVFWKRFKPF